MKRETFWEVEWYGEPPLDENGDSDWDRIPCYCKNFATKEAALKFAAQTVQKTRMDATVGEWWKKPCRYEVRGWEQEYIGDGIPVYGHENNSDLLKAS